MKKLLAVMAALAVLFGSFSLAEDLSGLSDQELLNLYMDAVTEVESRMLSGTAEPEIPEAEEAAGEDDIAVNRLLAFFLNWRNDQKDSMLDLCSPEWKAGTDDPGKELFVLLENRTPLDFWMGALYIGGEVENVPAGTVWTGEVNTLMDRNNGTEPKECCFSVRMVKAEDGQWYVDPTSLNSSTEPAETAPEPGTEAAETAAVPEDDSDLLNMVLFYQPQGGQYYHAAANCPRVHPEFQPLSGMFQYGELNYDEYKNLQPCEICGAPSRENAPAEPAGFMLKVYDRTGLGNISYLRVDYSAGGDQLGYICSCPNEGEDFYRFPIETRDTNDLKNITMMLSYGVSDLTPEEAILRVMSGEPVEEHPLLMTDLEAESGKTYTMDLVPSGWQLVPAEESPAGADSQAGTLSDLSDPDLMTLYRDIQEEMTNRGIAGGNGDAVAYAQSGKADQALTERLCAFFSCWSDNDLDGMLELCAPSWCTEREQPKTELFVVLMNRTPLSFETALLYGDPDDEVRTVEVITNIDRNNGKEPAAYLLNVRMKKEDGLWYVDPASLALAEAEAFGPEISEPAETPGAPAADEVRLYYVENGGEKYHADQNCKAVNPKYLPMTDSFTLGELNGGAHPELTPCKICNAPVRETP